MQQRIVKFRPLRIIKKTGKIAVASYMEWRKVKTADYEKFNLMVSDDYKRMNKDENVHNHKGELLYWFNHNNPEILPRQFADIEAAVRIFGVDESYFEGEEWKLNEPLTQGFHWSVRGFDCDGVPVFSHYSQSYVADNYKDMNQFEPLTVGMVVKWLGWFLYQLQNSYLIK